MSEILAFAMLGLGAGGAYALNAIGIVAAYRATKVINFASGAIGMVGTYFYYELHDKYHVQFVAAAIVGIAVSSLLGLATYVLVMRPLRRASQLAKIVATLAVLAILNSAAGLRYVNGLQVVRLYLPTGTWKLLGVRIAQDSLYTALFVVGLALVLMLAYRFTEFGRATTAVAENERIAETVGISSDLISGINWAISGAASGTAGILLAPQVGLGIAAATLVIVPALAAAVVGKLESFPLAVVGGFVLGIAESLIGRYVSNPGWTQAAPFIMLTVVLLVQRGRSDARGTSVSRLPSVGTGRVRLPVVLAVSGCLLLVTWLAFSVNWVDAVALNCAIGIIVLSQLVVTGYAGQLSLAQFALAGGGAFVTARLVSAAGVPFGVAAICGVLATVPVGMIVGLAGMRAKGANLAILTLGLAAGMNALVFTNPDLASSVEGLNVGSIHLLGIDIGPIDHPKRYATVALMFLVVTSWVIANIRRGRVGRRMLAVRANERAAASLGVSVLGTKLYSFVVGGLIAAVGGILFAFTSSAITFTNYDPMQSVSILEYNVIGGSGWVAGSPLGGALAPGAVGTNIFNLIFGQTIEKYIFLIGGVLLLLVIVLNQDGLASANYHLGRAIWTRFVPQRASGRSKKARTIEDRDIVATSPARAKPLALVVENMRVQFGGVIAVDGLSLSVAPGEIVGLIGPNGAGKTTVIDAITGFASLRSGRITLGQQPIGSWPIEQRARGGLCRSFQSLELFDDMSVDENLRVASDPKDSTAYVTQCVSFRDAPLPTTIRATVTQFGLDEHLDAPPTELSYGRRRLLGIARTVACHPSIILLDEPAAGLSQSERKAVGQLIRSMAKGSGIGILLVEHDVPLVMDVCDRVYVMNYGKCIAVGSPSQVRSDPGVIEAYLGTHAVTAAEASS